MSTRHERDTAHFSRNSDTMALPMGHSLSGYARKDGSPLRDLRQTHDKKIPSTMVVALKAGVPLTWAGIAAYGLNL